MNEANEFAVSEIARLSDKIKQQQSDIKELAEALKESVDDPSPYMEYKDVEKYRALANQHLKR